MARKSRNRTTERVAPPAVASVANFPHWPRADWPTVLVCLGLLLLVVVPYAQVYSHKFIICDDDVYGYENYNVKAGLRVEGIKWAFEEPHAGNWHPLTWMSHMLDWQVFGDWAGGHHL